MIGVQPDSLMQRSRQRASGPNSAGDGHNRRPAAAVDIVRPAGDGIIREWVNTLLAIVAIVISAAAIGWPKAARYNRRRNGTAGALDALTSEPVAA